MATEQPEGLKWLKRVESSTSTQGVRVEGVESSIELNPQPALSTLPYDTVRTLAQPAASAESGSGIPVEHRPTASAIDQFQQLDQPGQAAAIRSLAANGYGDHEVARITGLHVEQVRRLLAVHADDAAAACAARWQEQR